MTPAPESGPPSRPAVGRRWPRRAGYALGGLALVMTAAWLGRVALAEWSLRTLPPLAGLPAVELRVADFTARKFRATGLALGDAATAREIEIDYSLGGLLLGRVAFAKVTGLAAKGRLDATGLVLDGMPQAANGGRALPLLVPNLASLALADAKLALDTPRGPAIVLADGRLIRQSPTRFDLQLAGAVAAAEGRFLIDSTGTIDTNPALGLGLSLDIALDADARGAVMGLRGHLQSLTFAGATTLRVVIAEGWASDGRANLAALKGQVEVTHDGGGLRRAIAALRYEGLDAQGVELPPGNLTLSYAGGAVQLSADLAWGDSRARLNANGWLDRPEQPLILDVAATLAGDDLAGLAQPGGTAKGRAELKLEGVLADAAELYRQPSWTAAATRFKGKASVALALTGGEIETVGHGLAASGTIAATADERGTFVEAADGLVIKAEQLGARLIALLPEALRGAAEGPLVLAIGAAGDRRSSLRWQRDGAASSLAISGDARFKGRVGDLTGEVDARVNLGAANAVTGVELPLLTLTVDRLAVGHGAAHGAASLIDFSGGPGSAKGRLTIDAALVGAPADGIALTRGDLALSGELAWRDGRIEFVPGTGARLRLAGFGWQDLVYLPGPSELTLATGANGVSVSPDTGSWRYVVTLAPTSLAGTALLPGGAAPIALEIPVATVHGQDTGEHSVLIRAARLAAADGRAQIQGLDLDLDWNPRAARIVVKAKEVRDAGDAPLLAPFRIDGEALLADGRFSYTTQIWAAKDTVRGSAEGLLDVASGRGETRFSFSGIDFRADGLQPAALLPGLGRNLANATGRMDLSGMAAWGGGLAVESRAKLELRDLAFDAGGFRVAGLSGSLSANSLMPLTTPPAQQISATLALGETPPMPLGATFALRPDGALAIDALTLGVAGGEIAAGPAVLDPSSTAYDFELAVRGVELGEILTLIDVDGLSGSGRLTGRIPVRVAGGEVVIAGAALKAEGPGTLRYTGKVLEQQYHDRTDTVALMMQALADFRYRSLSFALDKPAEGVGKLTAALEGANPAVLDGYPFVLNIAVESDFDRLAALALQGLGVAGDVARWARGQLGPGP